MCVIKDPLIEMNRFLFLTGYIWAILLFQRLHPDTCFLEEKAIQIIRQQNNLLKTEEVILLKKINQDFKFTESSFYCSLFPLNGATLKNKEEDVLLKFFNFQEEDYLLLFVPYDLYSSQ